jgi:hypothetical protein
MSGKRKLSNDNIYVLPFDISRLISHPKTACPACHLNTLAPVAATPSSIAFAVCTSCKRRIELHTVPESPEPQPTPTAPTTGQTEPATWHQAFRELQARMDGFDQLLAENAALRKENAAIKAQLAALQATPTNQQQQQQPRQQQHPRQQQPPRQQPTVAPATTTPTTWAQRAASGPKVPNARKVAAAARAFQPNTGPQGYEFVYIPRTRRLNRSEVRSRLRSVGVDTARVLDIIYPARDVLGLLVHAQYLPLIRETLLKQKIHQLASFDPLDTTHIADPKHASLTTDDRCRLAVDLHRERLLRGLEKMRPHVRPAVTRSYVEIGWIAETDVPQRNDQGHHDAGAVFRGEERADDIMSEDAEEDECL